MQGNFLAGCETEKLHLSGCIQPHGALVAVNASGQISHVTENIALILPDADQLQPGAELPESISRLVPDSLKLPVYTDMEGINDSVIDLTITQADGTLLLEFLPRVEDERNIRTFAFPSIFNDQVELDCYRADLLQWISQLTGHDRCMYYQFVEQGDGVVVDEVCTESAKGTYLGLRYPASDIPRIARELYIKNPWRMIPDAQAESVNIRGTNEALNLSLADLRSVSPVHQIYMKNMGVVSSVSFPVIRGDDLDALISCHSSDALCVPRRVLLHIAKVVSLFNSLLKEFDIRKRMQQIDEFNNKNEHLRRLVNSNCALEDVWEPLVDELKRNFNCEGVFLCTDEVFLASEKLMQDEALTLIDEWFSQEIGDLVFQAESLREHFDETLLTEIAGVCGVKFRSKALSRGYVRLYLTRSEHIYEVKWGGNPNKPVESHDGVYGISPRQSFSKWVERRLGYCKPWPSMLTLELHRLRSILETSQTFNGES
jgi:light-regulated signal transduction histidine kinase (bacteriophytochrome)